MKVFDAGCWDREYGVGDIEPSFSLAPEIEMVRNGFGEVIDTRYTSTRRPY